MRWYSSGVGQRCTNVGSEASQGVIVKGVFVVGGEGGGEDVCLAVLLCIDCEGGEELIDEGGLVGRGSRLGASGTGAVTVLRWVMRRWRSPHGLLGNEVVPWLLRMWPLRAQWGQ